ncbi:hypothetical protein [Janibacter sp. GS2]|uniref:hypothetical protein n=1 Tax=Janibacter sp. GS2 TaxID=3442646 RepID=UPI003EBA1FD2
MADYDSSPTSPIPHSTSRTYRAEDDLRGRGGRTLARVLSPVVAVLPWSMTVGGLWAMARVSRNSALRLEPAWGWLLGALALLVLAALVWAALTAWSSVGTTLAGLCTLALGVAVSIPALWQQVSPSLSRVLGQDFWFVINPTNCLLMGSLLLAAGLGAAGARRLRR